MNDRCPTMRGRPAVVFVPRRVSTERTPVGRQSFAADLRKSRPLGSISARVGKGLPTYVGFDWCSRHFGATVLVAVFLMLASTLLHAGDLGSYALTQLSAGPGGGQKAETRWFVTPEKSRTEMAPDAGNPGGAVVVITRRDKGVAWTLFPAKNAYMERALEEGDLRKLGERFKADLKVEDLGRDKILGHDCKKQKVRSQVRLGTRTVQNVQIVWNCADFDIPLRVDGEDGSRIRTTKLEVGPQSDGLFQVPRGYRKVQSLMEIMGSGRGR